MRWPASPSDLPASAFPVLGSKAHGLCIRMLRDPGSSCLHSKDSTNLVISTAPDKLFLFFQSTKEKLEGKGEGGEPLPKFFCSSLQEIEGTKSVKLRNLVTKWEHPHSLQISTRCKTGERDVSGQHRGRANMGSL